MKIQRIFFSLVFVLFSVGAIAQEEGLSLVDVTLTPEKILNELSEDQLEELLESMLKLDVIPSSDPRFRRSSMALLASELINDFREGVLVPNPQYTRLRFQDSQRMIPFISLVPYVLVSHLVEDDVLPEIKNIFSQEWIDEYEQLSELVASLEQNWEIPVELSPLVASEFRSGMIEEWESFFHTLLGGESSEGRVVDWGPINKLSISGSLGSTGSVSFDPSKGVIRFNQKSKPSDIIKKIDEARENQAAVDFQAVTEQIQVYFPGLEIGHAYGIGLEPQVDFLKTLFNEIDVNPLRLSHMSFVEEFRITTHVKIGANNYNSFPTIYNVSIDFHGISVESILSAIEPAEQFLEIHQWLENDWPELFVRFPRDWSGVQKMRFLKKLKENVDGQIDLKDSVYSYLRVIVLDETDEVERFLTSQIVYLDADNPDLLRLINEQK